MVHRWAGLTIAAFLIVAGLTGAVLPWEERLTLASRPSLSRVEPPRPGATPLDGITLADRVERRLGARVAYLPLDLPRDRVARLFVTAAPGRPPLRFDVVWADPYTGQVRLTYRFGGVTDGPENIVPFLYALHYGFVAGPWGEWVFGIAALIWTADCFVGFYLTFPIGLAGRRRPGANWLHRWSPAWRVRHGGGYKLTFDLHRAGGLWLWPLLFVFAWSGVGLALPQVARPMMRLAGATTDFVPKPLPQPAEHPAVDARAAVRIGTAALGRIGARRGFTVGAPQGLSYLPASAVYRFDARTSLDRMDQGGRTTLWIDGRSGRPIHFDPPLGATRADAFMQWLYLLHLSEVGGVAYGVAVSATGLAVVALSMTGVLIWQRKRRARQISRHRRPGVMSRMRRTAAHRSLALVRSRDWRVAVPEHQSPG